MPCLIWWDDNDDDGWVKKDHGSSSFVKEGFEFERLLLFNRAKSEVYLIWNSESVANCEHPF